MKIKDKFYVLFALVSFLLALFSLNFYQGSKIVYLIYSITAIIFFIYLTNSKSFFVENFLALYFYLGYWFSFSIKISFFDSNFVGFSDGFGNFDFSQNSFDEVLIICIWSFLSIIFASYIRRKFCTYDICSYNKLKNFSIYKLREDILSLFIFFFALIICFVNSFYSIFQRGTLPNLNVNFFLSNSYKWFLTFGYMTLFCFFINYFQQFKTNSFSKIQLYIYYICELLVHISILSRGLIFNGLSILWGLKKTGI
jgi:hypothetical protein